MKNSKPNTAPKMTSSHADIVQVILNDHKPLKALIKIMKGEKPTFAQKKAAFAKFAPTLIAHAKPEEQTWYKEVKSERGHRAEGLEGDVEHGLADQLSDELKHTSDHDMFMAKVKVLAELVEHHIQEEEGELLPKFKKRSTLEERISLGEQYLAIQQKYISPKAMTTPRSRALPRKPLEASLH